MPSSKIIPVKHGGVEKVLRYLVDKTADSHREYELTPLQLSGVESSAEFVRLCCERARAHRLRALSGRPSENSAYWYIVRFPDGSGLQPEERRICMNKIREEACGVGHEPAIFNEHLNLIFRSQDFNVLTPTFDVVGLSTRGALFHPVRELRTTMDDVAAVLNAHRSAANESTIPEMRMLRMVAQSRKTTPDLVEALGALPKPPGNQDELLASLWSMGWSAEFVGKRKKRILIIDTKKSWKREIDIESLLTLIVRWRVSRFRKLMVRGKTVSKGPEKSPIIKSQKMASSPHDNYGTDFQFSHD